MELKRKMPQESILLQLRATAILPTKKNNSYSKEIVVLSKRNNFERCPDEIFLQNLTFLLRGFVVEKAEYANCNKLCSAKRIVNW